MKTRTRPRNRFLDLPSRDTLLGRAASGDDPSAVSTTRLLSIPVDAGRVHRRLPLNATR